MHKWFKGSKSKMVKVDGLVNVVTGGTHDEADEGDNECVSSAKRASMSKKENSAARRKKRAVQINKQSLVLQNQLMSQLTNQKRK